MENYGFQTHYMNSAYPIYGSGTSDLHGGHAREHKDMIVDSILTPNGKILSSIFSGFLELDIELAVYGLISV